MFTRIALAFVLFVSPAVAGEAPYVTASDIDLRVFLPRPVQAGSEADKAQQAEVLAVQKAASPERIALAAADGEETVFDMYARVFGPDFKPEVLPRTAHLFGRVGESEDASVDPAKPFFGRVRPYLANPQIKPLAKASKSGSFPSGHTTRVTAVAVILTMMAPEKRDEIWSRAEEYAESRIVAGLHYRADIEAGFRTGSALAAAIMANADFRADYPAARAELRTALGLTQ
ncbi:phosphatase PAP2 family protein [Alsobacter sp. KACC 23698]|uniref:Phosphatase PAP2 family protein n=1 Tax=Alsobacter sp. KACC 23698 TaxID=3149229 RepID=A0AAU7JKI9_9HYPH